MIRDSRYYREVQWLRHFYLSFNVNGLSYQNSSKSNDPLAKRGKALEEAYIREKEQQKLRQLRIAQQEKQKVENHYINTNQPDHDQKGNKQNG
ncbi:hypothetical protein G9A89_016207 [Geosiphon pyriformis]|nr:hypothetical protein G9A89_016207 [Geosiphon pyriformis]